MFDQQLHEIFEALVVCQLVYVIQYGQCSVYVVFDIQFLYNKNISCISLLLALFLFIYQVNR